MMFGKYTVAAALVLGLLFSAFGVVSEVGTWLSWKKIEARVSKVYFLCDVSFTQIVSGEISRQEKNSMECAQAQKDKANIGADVSRYYIYKRPHYVVSYNTDQRAQTAHIRNDGHPLGEENTMLARKINLKLGDVVNVRVSPDTPSRVRSLTDWEMLLPFFGIFIFCLLGLTLDQWTVRIAGREPRHAPFMWIFEN